MEEKFFDTALDILLVGMIVHPWLYLSIFFSCTLIGHLNNEKGIKYPKFLAIFIDKKDEKGKILSDYKTHKSVLVFMLINLFIFLITIASFVLELIFKSNVNLVAVLIVNILLFIYPYIVNHITHLMANNELEKYNERRNECRNSLDEDDF